MRALSFTIIPLAMLAACSSNDGDPKGTTMTVDATSSTGQKVGIDADGDGKLKVDLPGFKAELAVPKIKLDAANFEMNGAKLYPGSTISAMNITGDRGGNNGGVQIKFEAPAPVEIVRQWFQRELAQTAGFTINAEGSGFKGATNEGKPFTLMLGDSGGGTSGTLVLSGG